MKKTSNLILSSACLASIIALQSCTSDPLSPGLEYMPDMYRGPAYETYGESPFSEKGSSLKPVAGTIPRFNDETLPYHETYAYPNTNEGYEAAGLGVVNPYPATELILEKGKKVYSNFCIHCHGEKGDGQGPMVVSGAYAGVPAYSNLTIAEGQMFYSIYYGKGMMGSHASLVNKREIWTLIHYIKRFQDPNYGKFDDKGMLMTAGTKPASDTTAVMK